VFILFNINITILLKLSDSQGQFLVRPYTNFFLDEMSKYYEIVIFTAALQEYADFILDKIDKGKVISNRLYRHHAVPNGPGFIKVLIKTPIIKNSIKCKKLLGLRATGKKYEESDNYRQYA
jgi:TFIIF-interacting CTD phosphatase-like protein